MSDVFISYAREDRLIALQVADDLRARGAEVWLDEESLVPGEDWVKEISQQIQNAAAFLVLVSPASLASEWVGHEWNVALARKNIRVLAALIGGATVSGMPPPLRTIQAVDLNKDYDAGILKIWKAVERLVKSTAPPAAEVINIAQLTEDITQKVLEQIRMRPATPDSSTGADAEDDKLVFVVCAFHPDMDPAFEAIAAAAASYDLRAERVKDIVGDYRITEKMLSMIRRARLVVADLTHERPNVYFELGYARGIGKTVITILREETVRHFDVYDWSYIPYTDSRPLERLLLERFGHELGPR
ncbi:MAG: TIR domain-containing protein [Pseudonocardiaceae bacterium]